MPKKKTTETQEAQSQRFREEVARLVAAGELNPTEADERFDRVVGQLQKYETSPKIDK